MREAISKAQKDALKDKDKTAGNHPLDYSCDQRP